MDILTRRAGNETTIGMSNYDELGKPFFVVYGKYFALVEHGKKNQSSRRLAACNAEWKVPWIL